MSHHLKVTAEQVVEISMQAWLNGVATGSATTAGMSGVDDDQAVAFGEGVARRIDGDPVARLQVEHMITNWLKGEAVPTSGSITVHTPGDVS